MLCHLGLFFNIDVPGTAYLLYSHGFGHDQHRNAVCTESDLF